MKTPAPTQETPTPNQQTKKKQMLEQQKTVGLQPIIIHAVQREVGVMAPLSYTITLEAQQADGVMEPLLSTITGGGCKRAPRILTPTRTLKTRTGWQHTTIPAAQLEVGVMAPLSYTTTLEVQQAVGVMELLLPIIMVGGCKRTRRILMPTRTLRTRTG